MSSNSNIIVVETERLLLRRVQLDDLEALDRIFGDAEVMRYGPGVQSAEWVRQWIQRGMAAQDAEPWIVVLKSHQEVIGYSGLHRLPDVDGRPEIEIGYRLARAHWGRGYATEVACAARDYGFETLNLARLIALIDPGNIASIRVAEKVGMQHEKDVMMPGYTHPDRVYAISRADFDASNERTMMDIESSRLRLTPYAPAHLLALIAGNDQFAASFGLPAAEGLREFFVSDDVSPAWLEQLRASTAPDPWKHGYAVIEREMRAVIGNVGFKGPPDAAGMVEIAYGTVPSLQCRGYATEAVEATLPVVFRDDRITFVRAHTLPMPNASTRVLTKCGFTYLGEVIDPDDGPVWRWEKSRATR